MKSRQLKVGITGGIGSGKSTICRVFETLGASTYYADDRAKWLMANDDQLINEIKNLFGEDAYNDGNLERKFIAGQAFRDQSLLEKLNQLVHPVVARDVAKWIQENQHEPLLLKEAALLFETGSYKSLDKTILVTAPEEIRIQRVAGRDAHRTKADIRDIINKQIRDEKKSPLADFVIENDGKKPIIKQAMNIYSTLIIA